MPSSNPSELLIGWLGVGAGTLLAYSAVKNKSALDTVKQSLSTGNLPATPTKGTTGANPKGGTATPGVKTNKPPQINIPGPDFISPLGAPIAGFNRLLNTVSNARVPNVVKFVSPIGSAIGSFLGGIFGG